MIMCRFLQLVGIPLNTFAVLTPDKSCAKPGLQEVILHAASKLKFFLGNYGGSCLLEGRESWDVKN